jgi:hypothetical protein
MYNYLLAEQQPGPVLICAASPVPSGCRITSTECSLQYGRVFSVYETFASLEMGAWIQGPRRISDS